ncbi:hypothetical protein ONS95_003507 [Cadophora gregata]|uniref:uncharacterized protein n=1 Tax=Cadophora gregata TaxID=51156 RepID=UPI0026DB9CA4|nr:uncharacterized protein ONS95_003507 [Cadophora gregata]KAK0099424.1 hypothetical protein ONS96_008449 [Cadophora gregata f. sp. sojae]KAK0106783.1 hypothetical protein ONS95_003507 [Cadophora gregata]
MRARVIDLTGSDSESDEAPPAHRKPDTMSGQPNVARQPLTNLTNGSRPNVTPDAYVPIALIEAIETMDSTRLRRFVHQFSRDIPEVRELLTQQVLVKGKDVVRYHRDSDSEDDVDSERESSEEEEEEGSGKVKILKPIIESDEEFVPLYAKCENCEQEFDVSDNKTRNCFWHPGEKELYEDDDFWADHDDQCHGDPLSFKDDPDYSEGFQWNCCENLGDHSGCKRTKHKAPVNIIRASSSNKKRRAEEDLQIPVFARCATCGERYDVNESGREDCMRHPGMISRWRVF